MIDKRFGPLCFLNVESRPIDMKNIHFDYLIKEFTEVRNCKKINLTNWKNRFTLTIDIFS